MLFSYMLASLNHFPCSLIPSSGFLLAIPKKFVFVHAHFFILEYLMQQLKRLKNSQVSNDYNIMTITMNHVSQCHKNILLLFHHSLDCP